MKRTILILISLCVSWLPLRAQVGGEVEVLRKELQAMKEGKGIHVKYVPGTFIPAQNKHNDYLIDRQKQKTGEIPAEMFVVKVE